MLYDYYSDLPQYSDIFYEGPTEFCAECNGEMESAYGDPWAEEEENTVDNKITSIFYGFHAADLFAGWDDDTEYNERASADKYAELVKAELSKQYPGAEVEVEYDTGAGGVLPSPLKCRVNDWDDHAEVPTVEHIAGLVYQDFEWCIEADED